MAKNGRSKTSRRNLGDYLQKPLSPTGTTVIAVRLPNELTRLLDLYRGAESRSACIRGILQAYLSGVATEGITEEDESDG